jgi:hypothetical protein
VAETGSKQAALLVREWISEALLKEKVSERDYGISENILEWCMNVKKVIGRVVLKICQRSLLSAGVVAGGETCVKLEIL